MSFKFIALAAAAATLVGACVAAQAHQAAVPGAPNWDGSWRPSVVQPRIETLDIRVFRPVANEALPLRRLAGIGPAYRGQRIESVIVDIAPRFSNGSLTLMVNGVPVDREFTGGGRRVELRPGQSNVIGSELRRLQLAVDGQVYVRQIAVNVASGGDFPQPYPQPFPPQFSQPPRCNDLDRQVNQDFRFARLDLDRLFNVGDVLGCRIEAVTIVAQTALGFGAASLALDGWQVSPAVQVANTPGQYRLSLNQNVDAGGRLNDLSLQLFGAFRVHAVRLELAY